MDYLIHSRLWLGEAGPDRMRIGGEVCAVYETPIGDLWEGEFRANAVLEILDDAIQAREPGDDDAILRWNTCVRMIERHPHCRPESTERREIHIE